MYVNTSLLRCNVFASVNPQMQPKEVLYENSCFSEFCKIHRKTQVLEFLFNKAAGLQDCNCIKWRLQCRFFLVNMAKFLRKPSFEKHLRTAASESWSSLTHKQHGKICLNIFLRRGIRELKIFLILPIGSFDTIN